MKKMLNYLGVAVVSVIGGTILALVIASALSAVVVFAYAISDIVNNLCKYY